MDPRSFLKLSLTERRKTVDSLSPLNKIALKAACQAYRQAKYIEETKRKIAQEPDNPMRDKWINNLLSHEKAGEA